VIPHVAKATGVYLNSMLAVTEANRAGYDEAILLTGDGFIADGSGENVFLVKDGELFTPDLSASILPGITRDTVIQIAQDLGYRVHEKPLIRSDLYLADEAGSAGRGRRAARDVGARDSARATAVGRARRRARPRGAALGAALARPDDRPLRGAAGRAHRSAVRRGRLERNRRPPPACTHRRARAGRRGDHVADLGRLERELLHLRRRDAGFRGRRPAHAESRSGGGRGGRHAADESSRGGRYVRLSLRARRAAGDLRAACTGADRGRGGGARSRVQGPPDRLARPARCLRLLSEQAARDRRGRRRVHAFRGGVAARSQLAQPRSRLRGRRM